MRHHVDGRKFGRNTSHRVAMLRALANAVIINEQIITTTQKAKEARRLVDRLVTIGKSGSPAARRLAFDRTRDDAVVKKLFDGLAKRFESRAGGYTRVLRLSESRRGDGAEMAVLELVDHPEIKRGKRAVVASKTPAKSDKKEADAKTSDPFSRFRRVFGGSKKKIKS